VCEAAPDSRLLARESEHGAQDPEPPLCMDSGAPPDGLGVSSEE